MIFVLGWGWGSGVCRRVFVFSYYCCKLIFFVLIYSFKEFNVLFWFRGEVNFSFFRVYFVVYF